MKGTARMAVCGVLAITLGAASACRSGKKTPPVSARSALADSADQVMYGARFNLTDHGILRAELNADTAFFFDDNTRVELSPVNTTFFTATGTKSAVLTSRRGTYRTQSGEMVARGDAVVDSQDGRRLRSEELKYDQNRNQVSSDSAFVLTEPDRRLEGVGFRSDPNLQHVQVLNAQSGTTGTVTIPNQ